MAEQITMKEPKKVAVGRRLAEYNCKKREELKAQKSKSKQVEPILTWSQYGIRAVLAVGVRGRLEESQCHAK